ncbi:CpaD family pilus assembly lipoprotein [Geminicoccus roseus]|uniref:CpaD family pilus assembly lipoprotein n=1 Tax=Geminicoccus roseus TaxID=404900 RepID=UPI0004015533|nr:CpaD family pilus assembly lipoprotein [Geminicoccus roseus]
MNDQLPLLMALLGALTACQPTPFPTLGEPGSSLGTSADASAGQAGPECPDWRKAQLEHPLDALLGNPAPAGQFALGCAQAANIRHMIADPGDLQGGGSTGAATATGAASAVERYHANKVTPLPDPALRSLGAGG